MSRERNCDDLSSDGMSRRRFLKGAAAGLGVLAAGPFLAGCGNTGPDISAIPEEIRDDILTTEELEKAHIKIYPTRDVKLYLRRSALEIPIFKDAKDGKINGAVVSLVDHDRISWNAVDRLPQDPKSFWQKTHREKNPKDWTESYWQDFKRRTQSALNSHQQSKKIFTEDLAMVISGESEKKVRDNVILFYRKLVAQDGADVKELTKNLKYWESELEDIFNGTRVTQLQQSIAREERLVKEANNAWVILHGPRDKAIEYFAEYGVSDPKGLIALPLAEWGNKAYIYLAVKGEHVPHPSQSFPGPDQFKVYPKDNGYRVLPKDLSAPGPILGHEVGHYEEPKEDYEKNEEAAYRVAYERLMKAWRQYQETGRTSGYPFVFVTKEGVTITKNRDPEVSAL